MRPHMDLDLSAIDAREEVLAEIRDESERQQREPEKARDQLAGMTQTQDQQAAISCTHSFEAAFEALLEFPEGIAADRRGNGVRIAVTVAMRRERKVVLL